MNHNFISSAYNALNALEKEAVNSFVQAVKIHAERNNELIIHALNKQIPADVVARSRGLLEKPLVRAAIYDKIMEMSDEQDLSAKRLLREHMNLAMSNMADYLKFPEPVIDVQTGKIIELPPEIDVKNCTREQMAAIKTFKVTSGIFGTKISLELHSKQTHLEALGKMMGLDAPDNPVYRQHMAAPKDVKPLSADATVEEADKAYMQLLEAIK